MYIVGLDLDSRSRLDLESLHQISDTIHVLANNSVTFQ